MFLKDRFGRRHTYLRISVTDRCNLNCIYCAPFRKFNLKPREEILSLEEIEKILKIFVKLGIKKVRITGGEPLLRKGIFDLLQKISKIKGIEKIGITTNGTLLKNYIDKLERINIKNLNVSLDTLNKNKFEKITLSDKFYDVLEGINLAILKGFNLKINTVIMKGINDDEIINFIDFFRDKPLTLRFIEYMPLGTKDEFLKFFLPYENMVKIINEKYVLKPVFKNDGVSKDYIVEGFKLKVGFITSISSKFCDNCNRLRITADGKLRTCLFALKEIDLKEFLRNGKDEKEIKKIILNALKEKEYSRPEIEEFLNKNKYLMRNIGG
jgi:cyclic pyranopterin phosphate synthase